MKSASGMAQIAAEALQVWRRVNPQPRYRRWGEKIFNAILDNAKAFRIL